MFCVKKDRHMFDDEVIYLNPRIKEETSQLVGKPRKYDNNISMNELHDFGDLLKFDKSYNGKYSKPYIQSTEPKTTQKRFSSQKERRNKAFLFRL